MFIHQATRATAALSKVRRGDPGRQEARELLKAIKRATARLGIGARREKARQGEGVVPEEPASQRRGAALAALEDAAAKAEALFVTDSQDNSFLPLRELFDRCVGRI